MKISIGARVGTGFITMLVLLVTCGMVGIYGVSKVSESLVFVTGDAWNTANGSMETTINLQSDMLTTERILSHGLSMAEGSALINRFYQNSEASLKQIKSAGIIDQKDLQQAEVFITEYQAARQSILANFQSVKTQQASVRLSTGELLNIIPDAQIAAEEQQSERISDRAFGIRMENAYFHLDTIRLNTLLLSFTLQEFFNSEDPLAMMDKIQNEREQLDFIFENTLELMSIKELDEPRESISQSYTDLRLQTDQLIADFLEFGTQRYEMSNTVEMLLRCF